MRHYGLFWGELGADLVGVKCCSHTLLLHAWVSVRRARSHPESLGPPLESSSAAGSRAFRNTLNQSTPQSQQWLPK